MGAYTQRHSIICASPTSHAVSLSGQSERKALLGDLWAGVAMAVMALLVITPLIKKPRMWIFLVTELVLALVFWLFRGQRSFDDIDIQRMVAVCGITGFVIQLDSSIQSLVARTLAEKTSN